MSQEKNEMTELEIARMDIRRWEKAAARLAERVGALEKFMPNMTGMSMPALNVGPRRRRVEHGSL